MTRRKRITPTEVPLGSGRPDRLIEHLVVMRESDGYDRALMAGMIQQTLEKVRHLPGAERLLEAGMDVYDHPKRYGARLTRRGKSRIAWVEVDGVLYMYSMGSAAASDSEDLNAFVEELSSSINRFKPAHLWALAFTRLIRAATFAGNLLKVCQENVETLHCEIDIAIATPEGAVSFQILSLVAAAERDYIVRRHTAGRVMQWKRGEWIPHAVPPGYVKVEGKLAVDPDQVDRVREMWNLIADPAKSSEQVIMDIGSLGIGTRKLKEIYGPDATVADARNSSEVLRTLLGWVDAVETGSYDLVWTNPFPGVKHIAGLEVQHVQETDAYPHGVLIMPYTIPLPDGGWATDETFSALRHRMNRQVVDTGGTSHKTAPPLTGFFDTTTDDVDSVMLGAAADTYQVLQRPADPDRSNPGWINDPAAIRIATLNRQELHQSIVHGIVAAVRSGLPASLNNGRYSIGNELPVDNRKSRLRAARRRLDQSQLELDRALRNARLAADEESARVFVEDVGRLQREVKGLTQELEELSAAVADPQLERTFETNAAFVVHSISALAMVPSNGPRELREALRSVIVDESLSVTAGTVTWTLSIELPHEDGVVTLGPITGVVRNRRPAAARAARANDGSPQRPGKLKAREITAKLVAAGVSERAAGCAAACSDPRLVQVLLASKRGRPDGVSPEWIDLIRTTYRNPEFSWEAHQWRLNDATRQHAVDTLIAHDGIADGATLGLAGLSESQIRYCSREFDAPSGAPVLGVEGRGELRRYLAKRCPHCEGFLDVVFRAPEVAGGLLCRACMRTREPDSPVFPPFYLGHLLASSE